MDEKLQKGRSEVRAVFGHWWELTWSLISANSLSIQVIWDLFYRKWFNAAVSSGYRKHHNRGFLLISVTNDKWQNFAQTHSHTGVAGGDGGHKGCKISNRKLLFPPCSHFLFSWTNLTSFLLDAFNTLELSFPVYGQRSANMSDWPHVNS